MPYGGPLPPKEPAASCKTSKRRQLLTHSVLSEMPSERKRPCRQPEGQALPMSKKSNLPTPTPTRKWKRQRMPYGRPLPPKEPAAGCKPSKRGKPPTHSVLPEMQSERKRLRRRCVQEASQRKENQRRQKQVLIRPGRTVTSSLEKKQAAKHQDIDKQKPTICNAFASVPNVGTHRQGVK